MSVLPIADGYFNDTEIYMLRLANELEKQQAPVVLRGGIVTKIILAQNGNVSTSRFTRDIDFDWFSPSPSLDNIVELIDLALINVNSNFVSDVKRVYSAENTAGIAILDKSTKLPVFKVDIWVPGDIDYTEVRTYQFGIISVNGYSPDFILSDKTCLMSTDRVFRRTKDLVDIYNLAQCIPFSTSKVYGIIKRYHMKLSTFSDFYSSGIKLENAYNKFKGNNKKIDFRTLYAFLSDFFSPFAESRNNDLEWDLNKFIWSNNSSSEEDENNTF